MGVHLFLVSEILRNLSKFSVKFTKKLKMYRKDIIRDLNIEKFRQK